MRLMEDGTYMQRYYSDNFFTLDEVREYETERLWSKGVEVLEHEFLIGDDCEVLIFYLILYFQSLMKLLEL